MTDQTRKTGDASGTFATGTAQTVLPGAQPGVFKALIATPGGLIGVTLLAVLLMVAVTQPMPFDPIRQNIPQRLQGPSSAHWLGTDQLGRDVFSRIIAGTRIALMISLLTAGAALLIGGLIGVLGGYFGGLADRIVVVFCDTLQSFPNIALALVVIVLTGPSLTVLIAVLVAAFAPYYARVARGLTLQIKERPYIQAERALGASNSRIILRHILPGMVPSMLTMVAMDIPTIITAEAGLSFLGLGIRPPDPSWGGIMYEGFGRITSWPWGVVAASVAIVTITLAFTLIGTRLKEMAGKTAAGGS